MGELLGPVLAPGARGSARACRAGGRGGSSRCPSRRPRARRGRPRASCSGRSEIPGRIGAMPTPTLIPASTSSLSARRRWRGCAVLGSVLRQTSSSSVGIEKVTATLGAPRRFGEDVDVAHDHRPARDQLERVRRTRRAPRGSRASAGSGPRPAGRGRSRRRSRRTRPPTTAGRAPARSTSATLTLTRIEVP